MPLPPIASMFLTIQQMKYIIHTVYSDSMIFIDGKEVDIP